MKSSWVWYLGVGALMAASCTREYVVDIRGVCFERDVLPIFQSNCTQSGCHNADDRKDGYDLSSYDGITANGIDTLDYRNSKLYQVLVTLDAEDRMPQHPYGRLGDAQIMTIALWIAEGARASTCNEGGSCATANMSYAADIQPILQQYCVGCHSGSSPSGGVSYSSYAGVKAGADNQSLMGTIRHLSGFSPMPKGANPLSSCSVSKIQAWIDAGALNN